jgi:hypothetical protein
MQKKIWRFNLGISDKLKILVVSHGKVSSHLLICAMTLSKKLKVEFGPSCYIDDDERGEVSKLKWAKILGILISTS